MDFKQKYWKWVIIVLCAVYCLLEVNGRGDFFIFLSAAGDLVKQQDIFSNTYIDGYHYYYSVLFAIVLSPFTAMPYLAVKFCWLFLNAVLFFDLLRMLYQSSFVKGLTDKQKNLFVVLVFLVSLRFFMNNIHLSQITILILWCCIKGLALICKERPISGALILALGINIKLLPVVFIPYLIYRGYIKAALLTVTFYLAFMFFPSLIIGHEYNISLLSTWAKLINPVNQNHVLDVDERSFHGLSTLLSTLFVKNVPDQYALKIPRNIADVLIETLSKIILVVRLILISFTLYFLKFSFFKKAQNAFSQCAEISYILLLIPLIFPHQQHYAFIFAIPCFALILYSIMQKPNAFSNKKIIVGLLIVIYLVFNLQLLLGQFNRYYEHFKLITYCALLLIPLLVMVFNKSSEVLKSKENF